MRLKKCISIEVSITQFNEKFYFILKGLIIGYIELWINHYKKYPDDCVEGQMVK